MSLHLFSTLLNQAFLLDDKFEGAYTAFDSSLRDLRIEEIIRSLKMEGNESARMRINDEGDWVSIQEVNVNNKESFLSYYSKLRKTHFINCWHRNDIESQAMWSQYTNNRQGIAIKTTIGKLRKALESTSRVMIDEVEYIDYDHGKFSEQHIKNYPHSSVFFHKRQPFEHESKFRVVLMNFQKLEDGKGNKKMEFDNQEQISGIKIPIDLSGLIDGVYVDPASNKEYGEIINSLLNVYGVKDEKGNILTVAQSSLNKVPTY
ncbi:hypothetical protein [Bacillus sp. 7894-2]|uniref:DUF2971 domain-containing protein n=1 Tax=Bacillus sp. 7894-2 TaxID=2021695 RepID=UPI000BA62C53|nr:hypothetical protein [Bacillus sp. 7894-2]PAE26858.1 hypothetical protein CHI10_01170 [Bacillus sp. 7894-2]